MSSSNGSEPRWRALVHAVEQGDAGFHAALVYGAPGADLEAPAEALARAWFGSEERVLAALESDRLVDLLRVRPEGPSRWIRLARVSPQNSGDADGISAGAFVRTRPLLAPTKVVWFDDADRLTNDAANALLKTLEEPPSHARFVLTTHEITRVPITVRSRCVGVAVELETHPDVDPVALDLTGGAPEFLKLWDRAEAPLRALHEALEGCQSDPPAAALRHAERFRAAATDLGDALEIGARGGLTTALELMGVWIGRKAPHLRERGDLVAEAHRLAVGNAQPGPLMDALFARLVAR